jgi:hypothetical protein
MEAAPGLAAVGERGNSESGGRVAWEVGELPTHLYRTTTYRPCQSMTT